jgi:hypothetical protein
MVAQIAELTRKFVSYHAQPARAGARAPPIVNATKNYSTAAVAPGAG